ARPRARPRRRRPREASARATPPPRARRASTACGRAARGARSPRAARPAGRARRARSRARSQEAAALTAVRRDLLDDAVALEQVHASEALAQLAGLRVSHVHTIADLELVRGSAEQRRLHLP